MKLHEIVQLSTDELKKGIEDTTKKINEMKFNRVIEPLQNPLLLRTMRREAAKMKTILHQRELGIDQKKKEVKK
jgi:large subunit ribosomal protein L29